MIFWSVLEIIFETPLTSIVIYIVNYHFDFLDEKLVFYAETKNRIKKKLDLFYVQRNLLPIMALFGNIYKRSSQKC